MSASRLGTPVALPTDKDSRPIVSRADLDAYDPVPRPSGGRERYACPIHGGDHQQSLSVDPDTGKFKCHACGAAGTLREHRAGKGRGATPHRTPAPSIVERGRRELAMKAVAEAERVERLGAELPAAATAFLSRCEAMSAALRDPECPGHVYLRRRGLDPLVAADLGAGYAPPNAMPGDHGRAVGRIVYPLADPLTGRIVSAAGRLCADASPTWPEARRDAFRSVKQRKLPGCPAGIWPYANLAAARAEGKPLVVVEGPADALALQQRGPLGGEVVALVGTANVLPSAALRGLVGVVLALDGDAGGVKGTRALQVDFGMAGVAATVVPANWLGVGDAKDPADLALRAMADDDTACAAYIRAIALVNAACRQVTARAWDNERAIDVMSALFHTCAAAVEGCAEGDVPPFPEDDDLDAAFKARDWPRLERAVDTFCDDYLAAVERRRSHRLANTA